MNIIKPSKPIKRYLSRNKNELRFFFPIDMDLIKK